MKLIAIVLTSVILVCCNINKPKRLNCGFYLIKNGEKIDLVIRSEENGFDTLLFSNVRHLAWDNCSVVAERDSGYKYFILRSNKLVTREFKSYKDVKAFASIYVSPGKYFSMGSASDTYSVLP